jgi:hypothetical protein
MTHEVRILLKSGTSSVPSIRKVFPLNRRVTEVVGVGFHQIVRELFHCGPGDNELTEKEKKFGKKGNYFSSSLRTRTHRSVIFLGLLLDHNFFLGFSG